MLSFWPIYKRELKTYFQSPSTFVVLALLFLIIGMIFQDITRVFSIQSEMAGQGGMFGQMRQAPNVTESVIRPVFHLMVALIMFTIPLLSSYVTRSGYFLANSFRAASISAGRAVVSMTIGSFGTRLRHSLSSVSQFSYPLSHSTS